MTVLISKMGINSQNMTLFLSVESTRIISKSKIKGSQMTRNVPIALAPVVERLELDQPEIVTLNQLRRIATELEISARKGRLNGGKTCAEWGGM